MRDIFLQRILWYIRLLEMIPCCWYVEDKCVSCFPMLHLFIIHLVENIDDCPLIALLMTEQSYSHFHRGRTHLEKKNSFPFFSWTFYEGASGCFSPPHVTARPAPLTRSCRHDYEDHRPVFLSDQKLQNGNKIFKLILGRKFICIAFNIIFALVEGKASLQNIF